MRKMIPCCVAALPQMATLVGAETGLALPTTALFDYPSSEALASFIVATQVGRPACHRRCGTCCTQFPHRCIGCDRVGPKVCIMLASVLAHFPPYDPSPPYGPNGSLYPKTNVSNVSMAFITVHSVCAVICA